VKQEAMVVTYSYWDGKGHRRAMRCLKGTTIGELLAKVKESVEELQDVSTSNLLFVKEDVIIPHHFTFHELITTKARGRNGGPLFIFDSVIDDDRDREDSHTAKVCERRWYEQNRHIFPASRWTIYTQDK
jgi:protein FAM50